MPRGVPARGCQSPPGFSVSRSLSSVLTRASRREIPDGYIQRVRATDEIMGAIYEPGETENWTLEWIDGLKHDQLRRYASACAVHVLPPFLGDYSAPRVADYKLAMKIHAGLVQKFTIGDITEWCPSTLADVDDCTQPGH